MNEIIRAENGIIADLTTTSNHYCSMATDTQENKALLYKAMNNPDKRIGDCINMEIHVKDVYCELVQCANKQTEEVSTVPRTVLIDENGVSYQAVSKGIFTAVAKLIQVFGAPTWETPIVVKVRQISRGDRNILTLDVN